MVSTRDQYVSFGLDTFKIAFVRARIERFDAIIGAEIIPTIRDVIAAETFHPQHINPLRLPIRKIGGEIARI